MANGSLARAAAGITAPSQGSILGDIADTASGFLQGVQKEKERKEKQALEDAKLALQVRAQKEIESQNVIAAEDADLDRAVRQSLANAQQDIGDAQKEAQELARDKENDRIGDRIVQAGGLRAMIENVYDKDRDLLASMEVDALTAFTAELRAERDREADIESSRLFSVADRIRVAVEIQDSADRENQLLRAERAELPGQHQEQLVNAIARGLIKGRPEFNDLIGDWERSLQLVIAMDPEDLQELLDEQIKLAGGPTTREQFEDLDARLVESDQRKLDAQAALNAVRENDRPAGQDVVGANGNPGPGVSGVVQPPAEEPVVPDPGSPSALSFQEMYNADVGFAARNLADLQRRASVLQLQGDPPPPGLADIEAWLSNIGKTAEDIFKEAEEEKAKLEEEAESAEVEGTPTGIRRSTNRQPRPGALPEAIGPVLSRSARRAQARAGRLAGSEEEKEDEIDPDIQDIEDQLVTSAGDGAVGEVRKEVAISEARTRMVGLDVDDLDAALGGFEVLKNLGLNRTEILASIPNIKLRNAVRDRTVSRISSR